MASTVWSGSKTFSATSGTETLVAVPVPHRARIRAYSLVQTSGSNNGATAKLLTSKQDVTPNSDLPESSFLLETLTIANNTASVSDNNTSLAYVNRDGTPTTPQRFLYLRVTPAGSGAKDFVFSLTVEMLNTL